jgi:uncharacterized membrane protein YgdD (TMEM256/DUF423 family)
LPWIPIGCFLALLAVAAGAFGAHGLKSHLSAARLETFETAVRYQMYHAIATILAGFLRAPVAGWCFVLGIAIFSGSLYLLVLTDARWLGALTPVGGLLFLIGWTLLAFSYKS